MLVSFAAVGCFYPEYFGRIYKLAPGLTSTSGDAALAKGICGFTAVVCAFLLTCGIWNFKQLHIFLIF